jgi:hypothetical protein
MPGADPNLWSVVGSTLHLGPAGGEWAAFPGRPDVARQIAEAHNHAVAAAYAGARADEPAIARERARADQAILEARAEAAALRSLAEQLAADIEEITAYPPETPLDALEADAGAALLAELEASRALIGALKEVLAGETSMSALRIAVAAYDEARK